MSTLEQFREVSFEWKDEYALGQETIDKEHKFLFEIARQIHSIENPDENKADIRKIFLKLFEYMKTHFQHEELLMMKSDYPELKQHQVLHQHIIAEMSNLLKSQLNIKVLFLRLNEMMNIWIVQHILEDDIKIKDHINKLTGKS